MKRSKNLISELTKNIPLKTRLNVSNEMAFIDLIVELGYRESKMWTDDEKDILSKLRELSRKHTESILEDIEEWESDGKP